MRFLRASYPGPTHDPESESRFSEEIMHKKKLRSQERVMIRFAAALLALGLSLAPASAAEKMTVLLDWFVNPDHAPLIVAKEKGFFEKHGLEVELVEPADPNLPPKLVAAGQGDIA